MPQKTLRRLNHLVAQWYRAVTKMPNIFIFLEADVLGGRLVGSLQVHSRKCSVQTHESERSWTETAIDGREPPYSWHRSAEFLSDLYEVSVCVRERKLYADSESDWISKWGQSISLQLGNVLAVTQPHPTGDSQGHKL